MKILVIGSGGREHALAWRLKQSPRVQKVFVAPGNGGTAREEGVENVAVTAIPDLVEFAKNEGIQLTVVGPEAPLAAGVVDAFRAAGLKIFGPVQAAAHAYIEAQGAPIVVKADGLAAGKGVVVAATAEEAHAAVDSMLSGNSMGEAGHRVVIEECLVGEEASFIVMVDGENILPLATSQDHKRLLDNDEGPNTGGMGAYSPAPVVTPEIHAKAMREVIRPVVAGMKAEGTPYTGFLYAGLMIDAQGHIKVLEFNCRMGDPETQPIMMRLKSDLVSLVEAAVDGKLDQVEAEWDRRCALGVVMAAAGYPDAPRKGDAITGLDTKGDDFHVFHAGTAIEGDQVVTSGGRVLCVTALGDTVKIAQARAYEVSEGIDFAGRQMRRDIGWRAIQRKKH
jgi:phosphoribosylamine--glycine ligase